MLISGVAIYRDNYAPKNLKCTALNCHVFICPAVAVAE